MLGHNSGAADGFMQHRSGAGCRRVRVLGGGACRGACWAYGEGWRGARRAFAGEGGVEGGFGGDCRVGGRDVGDGLLGQECCLAACLTCVLSARERPGGWSDMRFGLGARIALNAAEVVSIVEVLRTLKEHFLRPGWSTSLDQDCG